MPLYKIQSLGRFGSQDLYVTELRVSLEWPMLASRRTLRQNLSVIFKIFLVRFFLNNQPDALIIQILFCYKTLHVSGIFSAHHQEFSTVHSTMVSFMQVSDDRFQAESGCPILTLILTLLGSGHQKPA